MKAVFFGYGYLGYNISQQLQKSMEVDVFSVESPYTSLIDKYTYFDINHPETIEGYDFSDCIVFDTIAIIPNNAQDSKEELERIKTIYINFLNSLKKTNAKKIIFFSSGGTVYGENECAKEDDMLHTSTLYAKSKVLEEELIKQSDIPYIIMRVSNPYGGYQDPNKNQGVIPILIRKCLNRETFELWNELSSIRDYIYIDDLVEAIKLLLEHDCTNEVVNVGSGQGTSMKQLIDTVESHLGQRVNIVFHKSDVPVVKTNVLDINKLENLTGFKVNTTLEEGLNKEIERIKQED